MPIQQLTATAESFPRIGVLRKGAPKPETGNKPGADLKHFRFDTQDKPALAAFSEVYGNEPNNIRVYLPYATAAENFDDRSWKEEWTASSLVRRCDGCNIVIQRKAGAYDRKPSPCVAPACHCKPIGRLVVIVRELKRLAYVEVTTTSTWDILEISRNLNAFQSLRGDLRGIPFILKRTPRMISTPSGKDGERARHEKWLISIEPDPQWVEAMLSVAQRDALPGGAEPLELAAPVLDEDDGEDDMIESPKYSQPQQQPQHQRQQEAMRGKPEAAPDEPFGDAPKKDAPKPTPEQRQEFAKLVAQVKAIGQPPCVPEGVATADTMQACIDQMKTKLTEFEKAGTPQ